jgi:hypothetical protein
MLALLYLLIIFFIGHWIVQRAFPWLVDVPGRNSLFDRSVNIPKWMITLPASWLVGALTINWLAFVLANFSLSTQTGAYTAMALAGFTCLILYWRSISWRLLTTPNGDLRCFVSLEFVYFLGSTALACFIAWHTLSVKDDMLQIGNSVWSDFGPHLAMIRSFSLGDNFPPQYPHFPDGNMRYHFLFQFLVATLEVLGFRIDWAFNIPSILSLISVFLLLYALAVSITGRRCVGVLAGLFFIFRSSFAFFSYVNDNLANGNLWQSLWGVTLHIGKTENENWGLWAQNVYANQRHFAFSIGIMILVLLAVLPLLQDMLKAQRTGKYGIGQRLKIAWLEKNAWWPQNWQRAIALGMLVGAIGFWNGAVVITTLMILFVLAFFCRHRGEFLLIAVLAVLLSLIQQHWFIGTGAPAVKPRWYFGFLAEQKTITGTIAFYIELLGLFLPLFLVSIFGTPKGMKALALAFISPLIFATLVSLTTDINANHKFIMISVMLSNIMIAGLLARFMYSRDNALKALAVIFSMILTVTGWVDLKTLYNMNKNSVKISLNDPITTWVRGNTNPQDVFLTDRAVLHSVQMAGRLIYFGWTYYAWSAGYDTNSRLKVVKTICGAENADDLLEAIHETQINFILIDSRVRQSKDCHINEDLISQNFVEVFRDDKDNTRIFDVNYASIQEY